MMIRSRINNIVKYSRRIHYIGQDYYYNRHSKLIENEILKNPKWYTAYTPYQSEISQGRLELTHNYQQIIQKITGNDISNAGLLDHAHSLFESIRIIINNNEIKNKKIILIDQNVFNNLKKVLDTYDKIIFQEQNIEIKYFNFIDIDKEYIEKNKKYIIGSVIFSSDKYGFINKDYDFVKNLKREINLYYSNKYNKEREYFINVISGDLLHHLYLPSHRDLGADISIGNIQRMGLPLFNGGPHGGYMAINDNLLRLLPGKLVGLSKDKYGPRYRLALQTREQHIKKNKATSNICTNQALMTNYMAAWTLLNGKKLSEYISNIINYRDTLSNNLNVNKNFIDTISFESNNEYYGIFKHNNIESSATYTNIHSHAEIYYLEEILKNKNILNHQFKDIQIRGDNILEDEIFNRFDNEYDFQRYLRDLEKKDFTLLDGMIPLGSCTMKYNDIESVDNLFKYGMNLHPYEKNSNKKDFNVDMDRLKFYLANLTGFQGISLQPLSGSHAEMTSLIMMKKYVNDKNKNIILIPESAHGTNPASVTISGCQVEFVKHNKDGSFNIKDLDSKIDKHGKKILGIMITHPSTYGFFDESVKKVIKKIKEIGGIIYLDGANMNSWVGKLKPVDLGFDMMHINMHKTFAIPHGGGGPGVGVLAVDEKFKEYLPNDNKRYKKSIGNISCNIFGNSSANLISLKYIEKNVNHFDKISEKAVYNANYLKSKLNKHFKINYYDGQGKVAHELIIDLSEFYEYGITENDFCKRMIDYGIHPPTMSWPVSKCIMIEPTETESIDNLDYLINTLISIKKEILSLNLGEDNVIKNSPHSIEDLFNWEYSYSKKDAFFPLGKETKKFWYTSNRVDDLYGDKLFYKTKK